MRSYALVEIEDGSEKDRRMVGDSEVSVIVIDWDTVETDGTAQDLINEIDAQYLPGEKPRATEQEVIDRLKAIVEEDDLEIAYEDDDEEDDEEEDEEDE